MPNGGQPHVVESLEKREDATSNVAAILDSLATVDQQDAKADKENVEKLVSGKSAGEAMVTSVKDQSW